jgi:hypothetical protein
VSKDTKGGASGRAPATAGTKRMPAAATDAVGRKLKESYGELLREPIPDKFMQLLQQLDEGARKAQGSEVAEDEEAAAGTLDMTTDEATGSSSSSNTSKASSSSRNED